MSHDAQDRSSEPRYGNGTRLPRLKAQSATWEDFAYVAHLLTDNARRTEETLGTPFSRVEYLARPSQAPHVGVDVAWRAWT